MLKVVRELEAAVSAALELGEDVRHDQRRRSLRRVERAVRTFRNEFDRVQRAFVDRNKIDPADQINHDSLTLDDESVGLFVDILTKLPSIYCSEHQGDGDLQPIDLNHRKDSFSGLDEIYESISELASQMVLHYAQMPLDSNLVDSLLDRVALLAFHGTVSCELISILNASVAAALSESNECLGSTETHSLHDGLSCEKQPLFLLGAEETLSLTRILTPISLNHLSRNFDFSVNILNGKEEMGPQEGEIGLRLLLFHIFRHLSDTVQEFDDGCQERVDTLKKLHNQWYRSEMKNSDEMEYDLENAFEDYMDMLTSFLVENIEFAFDTLNVSNKLISEISEDDDCSDQILRQIKQVTRLTSLSIGLADLFHEDLNFDMSLFRSQLEKLFINFASYVANYCHRGFIPRSHNVILLADETLFRLYAIVITNTGEKSPKRNRICSNSTVLQKHHAQTIAYLRASYLATSEFDDVDTSILNIELERMSGIIRESSSNQSESSSLDSHTALSMLQARALSCMVIGEHDDPQLQSKNNVLLSLLLTSLNKNQEQRSDGVSNASKQEFNPWNYLLAQKIMESNTHPNGHACFHELKSSTPPHTILSNASSSVSDLRSHTPSSGYGRHDAFYYSPNVISFARSVPSHINTLCRD